MGPFYKRKSDRQLKFTKEILEEIKEKIKNGQSKRGIAKEYGMNESTLRKRLKLGNIPTSLGRFKPVFDLQQELELVTKIKQLDQLFYGLTIKDLRSLTYQFAEEIKVEHPFNKTTKLVGKKWIATFCQKNGLAIRQPEKVSVARTIGFNKVQVSRFFENLLQLIEKYSFTGKSIFNMDETGMLTVPNKIPKVVSVKGKKVVGKVVSGERGLLITAVCCSNARGFYVPPALIYPRKREKQELLYGAPEDTIMMLSDSGFINSELFIKWLKHFQGHVRATIDNPVLLILDNHTSHISLEAVSFCRSNGIHLLSLPPHSSHRLQPLDVGFFGPLKSAYSQEADRWMTLNPGKVITIYQVAALFGKAYARISSIDKAEKCFSATGIWPYNPNVFDDIDFLPASVTDNFLQNVQEVQIVIESEEVQKELLNNLPTIPTVLASANGNCEIPTSMQVTASSRKNSTNISTPKGVTKFPQPGSSDLCTRIRNENNDLETYYYVPPEKDGPTKPLKDVNKLPVVETVMSSPQPGPSKSEDEHSSILDILYPLPKAAKNNKKRKTVSRKSEILTSTPYKESLDQGCLNDQKKKSVKRDLNKKPRITSNQKTELTAAQTKKKKNLENTSRREIGGTCPTCQEVYYEPPETDLIQCKTCEQWFHEICTSYEGCAEYFCELCPT